MFAKSNVSTARTDMSIVAILSTFTIFLSCHCQTSLKEKNSLQLGEMIILSSKSYPINEHDRTKVKELNA